MTGSADVDGFKICFQDWVFPGFWPLVFERSDLYCRWAGCWRRSSTWIRRSPGRCRSTSSGASWRTTACPWWARSWRRTRTQRRTPRRKSHSRTASRPCTNRWTTRTWLSTCASGGTHSSASRGMVLGSTHRVPCMLRSTHMVRCMLGLVYTKLLHQYCDSSAGTLAIVFSFKTMGSLENGVANHFQAT